MFCCRTVFPSRQGAKLVEIPFIMAELRSSVSSTLSPRNISWISINDFCCVYEFDVSAEPMSSFAHPGAHYSSVVD